MKKLLQMVVSVVGKIGLLKYIALGVLSGLWSFLIIKIIAQAIKGLVSGSYHDVDWRYIAIFIGVIFLLVWTRRTLSLGIIKLSQKLFWALRKEILGLVLNSDYPSYTQQRDQVYAAIVHDVNTLTNASLMIINVTTAFVIAVSSVIYLLWVSWSLFLITLAVTVVGIIVYYLGAQRNKKNFKVSRNLENRFLNYFNMILDGFKEIFTDRKKGEAIVKDKIDGISNEAYHNNVIAYTGFLNYQITGQVLSHFLILSVLLFFSVVLDLKTGDVIGFVFVLSFFQSAIETIMLLFPDLVRAKVSSDHLMALRNTLNRQRPKEILLSNEILLKDSFQNFAIKDLKFSYGADQGDFTIGPIDFEIKKGEVVFIYGGNGSGKTTFMNSILGLCEAGMQSVEVNGQIIEGIGGTCYNSLFSVVYSDFYLFDELYGIEEIDHDQCDYYLELFELKVKVQIQDKGFSTKRLSSGQRKKLALIAKLLEDRPILILDEWAADLDPYFRKKFYTHILKLLKQEGFSILAITHDDKYYHCADRLFKMEEGIMIEEEVKSYETNYSV